MKEVVNMTIDIVVNYILKYGMLFIFFIVYLEELNCPGLGAAILFPAIGAFIAYTGKSFLFVFILTVIAGILGSLTLYVLGYYVGNPLLEWFARRFVKTEKYINKIMYLSERYGSKGVFICRLLPAVRTIVSLISGTLRESFIKFTIYSAAGISIWNFVLILSGYLTTKSIL